jgi:NADPH2:quinone reductase
VRSAARRAKASTWYSTKTLAECLAAARDGGIIVNIGRLDRAESTIDLDVLSHRRLMLRGVSFVFTRAAELGGVIAGLDAVVLPTVAKGRIRPVIDSVHDFDGCKAAADRLRNHAAEGKVVMTVP